MVDLLQLLWSSKEICGTARRVSTTSALVAASVAFGLSLGTYAAVIVNDLTYVRSYFGEMLLSLICTGAVVGPAAVGTGLFAASMAVTRRWSILEQRVAVLSLLPAAAPVLVSALCRCLSADAGGIASILVLRFVGWCLLLVAGFRWGSALHRGWAELTQLGCRCVACGYSLLGLSPGTPCPECGRGR
jgi:hypothetical protein